MVDGCQTIAENMQLNTHHLRACDDIANDLKLKTSNSCTYSILVTLYSLVFIILHYLVIWLSFSEHQSNAKLTYTPLVIIELGKHTCSTARQNWSHEIVKLYKWGSPTSIYLLIPLR